MLTYGGPKPEVITTFLR